MQLRELADIAAHLVLAALFPAGSWRLGRSLRKGHGAIPCYPCMSERASAGACQSRASPAGAPLLGRSFASPLGFGGGLFRPKRRDVPGSELQPVPGLAGALVGPLAQAQGALAVETVRLVQLLDAAPRDITEAG